MNNEEEILKQCNKLFVTMANVHIDGKPMADLLKLYNSKKEEIYSIAKTNYMVGVLEERDKWYKKINEKIEYIEKEMEKDKVDEFGIHSQGWLALDWFVDNLKELIGKEE